MLQEILKYETASEEYDKEIKNLAKMAFTADKTKMRKLIGHIVG